MTAVDASAPSAMLRQIEQTLDAGEYRAGPWEAFLRAVARRPAAERAALAADISRVSRKLHGRHGTRRLSLGWGIAAELAATLAGAALLLLGLRAGSTAAMLIATGILVTTVQPLVKLLIGTLLGIGYDYAYLFGVEPRFKMRYGTYVAAARSTRVLYHLSGTVGSPLAAWVASRAAWSTLPRAAATCRVAFWVLVSVNVAFFVAALAGWRRVGPLRLALSSGGSAGAELRGAWRGERR